MYGVNGYPNDLVEKLDSYDNLRSVNLKLPPKPHVTKAIYPKRNQYQSTRFEQRDDDMVCAAVDFPVSRRMCRIPKVGGIPARQTPLYHDMVVECQEL
ncbi:hypothetical protein HNY73_007317 [Argiope bruennichi]|uniref:Uncharacterized protein n=1 Tax=Argiope bruennichi TaxID=94029 RepID=A0A8T0FDK6_ARGBR|nr:hypothetical protein HNY73_007317 [Argiope bruennichi]